MWVRSQHNGHKGRHTVARRVLGIYRYAIFIAVPDSRHRLPGDDAGALRAFEQDLLQAVRLGEHRRAPLADRIEVRVERAGQLRLDLDVADLAGAVPRLQVLDFRRFGLNAS